jgi:hypothetical protein
MSRGLPAGITQLSRFLTVLGLVASLAIALSAQTTSLSGTADQKTKTIQSIRVRVIGCVADGREAGHYLLTNAFLGGDDVSSTGRTLGKAGGKDISFENSPSYELIGGQLDAQAGHKVEIIGITSDAKLNSSDAISVVNGSAKQKATLTVGSIKMIAVKCQ